MLPQELMARRLIQIKIQVMTYCKGHFTTGVFLNGEEIKEVTTFKYLI